jgi:hypothetical protein
VRSWAGCFIGWNAKELKMKTDAKSSADTRLVEALEFVRGILEGVLVTPDEARVEALEAIEAALALTRREQTTVASERSSADKVLEALRRLVCAADELTDGQIDPDAGSAEREFLAALETARAAMISDDDCSQCDT